MREIYRVNDWVVEDLENINQEIKIRNTTHIDWTNYYSIPARRYLYRRRRVPVSVDRAIHRYLQTGEVQTSRRSSSTRRSSASRVERTFGIEIECFHRSNYSIKEDVSRALEREGIHCTVPGYTHTVMRTWKVVTDASIQGGTGLEVVSPILKGQEGIDEVKKVMKILSDLGCRVNKSTGMHVHIGANDLSGEQLHNVFNFYRNNEMYFDELVAYSRRNNNNSYCRSLRDYNNEPSTRYTKVNYQAYLKYGTLEFRQHQGSLNGDKAEHWIKLVRAVVDSMKANKSVTRATSLEEMLKTLGLRGQVNWYLERAEELAV